ARGGVLSGPGRGGTAGALHPPATLLAGAVGAGTGEPASGAALAGAAGRPGPVLATGDGPLLVLGRGRPSRRQPSARGAGMVCPVPGLAAGIREDSTPRSGSGACGRPRA